MRFNRFQIQSYSYSYIGTRVCPYCREEIVAKQNPYVFMNG